MDAKDLKKIIEQVLSEMNITPDGAAATVVTNKVTAAAKGTTIEDGYLDDITQIDLRKQYLVPNPVNGEAYMEMKQFTPSRVGIWRAGARYLTSTYLRFRADHSAAQDAVFSDVSEEFLKEIDLFSVKSRCESKDGYITRPDLGRQLDDDAVKTIKEKCKMKPTVQIMVADGLSSSAIEANVKDVLPAIMQGLKSFGIDVGTPFFVKYGRVGVMDHVSEVVGAEVTCLLVGERPGLVTAESMSAYIVYKATVDMPEARRTVVSNIHRGGTIPVEAGAHIAEIIKIMLEKKASGTDLKL
ncbi:ethanolamine ammonia-lyase light chain [Hydrogenoanaerobacterium saccharovorans]|uniref:Ethanolamine ammonia-lyase small subunit n=1 Tax=Hydrogenoanaerobacterium saccharovorans TaxID=474960 RepID=A0A1H7ZI02_9FIRM|nr:ethanolamine ammonia-lyase subunit EutC [Hydrogenoanaerobacterium saccharovorans]RPF48589.1 ethanolamine ammonia-lyase light chain [Hydrogenoanaerobacterium saccharovorans]SEM57871.1 Ethanolamine ammonia-lyase light chain [Hydrogenoanaerobacterium saccharovorans]